MKLAGYSAPLLDLVYPRSCLHCGGAVGAEGLYWCWDCLTAASLIQPPYCHRCGDPISGRVDHDYECHLCTSRTMYLDRARSAARFDGVVRDAVIAFKYRNGLWAGADLTSLLRACMYSEFEVDRLDAIASVPLFPLKQRQRGYNQSHLLAKRVAKLLRKPMLPRLLRRVRNTRTQTHLTAAQRLTNVTGAFYADPSPRISGKTILLVDDVMTTGATVNECAKALKRAGAARVEVVTVARG